MTLREATIQAMVENGLSRETAEMRTKMSKAFLPNTIALTEGPVKPGSERAVIEFLKKIYCTMDAYPLAAQS